MKPQPNAPGIISCSILLTAVCALLSGCSVSGWPNPSVSGSGKLASESRNVTGFDQVSLSGSGRLTIVQGDQEGLTITADDNLLPLIRSDVDGGLLKIGPEHVNLRSSQPIRFELRLKNLQSLHLSGSLEAEAQSLKTGPIIFTISGSGKIRIPKIKATGLEVHISGSGDVELAGKVDQQKIHISGSGNYRAADCESQNTEIHISGSGDATIWALAALEASVSGSGGIKYYGSPQVNTHISGSGSVHSLGSH